MMNGVPVDDVAASIRQEIAATRQPENYFGEKDLLGAQRILLHLAQRQPEVHLAQRQPGVGTSGTRQRRHSTLLPKGANQYQ